MIKFIVVLALFCAAAFFAPPFLEGTEDVCAAFEHRIGTLLQNGVPRLSPGSDPGTANGLIAEAYIHDRFAQLPPVAGCAAAYWKVTFNPDLSRYARGKLSL